MKQTGLWVWAQIVFAISVIGAFISLLLVYMYKPVDHVALQDAINALDAVVTLNAQSDLESGILGGSSSSSVNVDVPIDDEPAIATTATVGRGSRRVGISIQ